MIRDLTKRKLTHKINKGIEHIPQRLNIYSIEDTKNKPKSKENSNKSTDFKNRRTYFSDNKNISNINYSQNCIFS
jgi:hypothetical protein